MSAIARLFVPEDEDTVDTLIEAESGDGVIDVHIGPRSPDVITLHLQIDQAWRFAQDLARAICEVEQSRA